MINSELVPHAVVGNYRPAIEKMYTLIGYLQNVDEIDPHSSAHITWGRVSTVGTLFSLSMFEQIYRYGYAYSIISSF